MNNTGNESDTKRKNYYVTTEPRIDRRDTIKQLNAIKHGEIPSWSEMFTGTLTDAVTLIEEMAWREETGLWEENYSDNETMHKSVREN